MAYYVRPFKKVGGDVSRVPHQIAPMLEHSVNQQISLLNLRSFSSTRKTNVDESFVSYTFKPDTAYQTLCSWACLSLQFR